MNEKEPWEAQLRQLWLHVGDYEQLLNFVKSLLDTQREWWQQHEKDMYEELEKSHREELDTQREEIVKEVEGMKRAYLIPKEERHDYDNGHNQALDAVIEKIKNK